MRSIPTTRHALPALLAGLVLAAGATLAQTSNSAPPSADRAGRLIVGTEGGVWVGSRPAPALATAARPAQAASGTAANPFPGFSGGVSVGAGN